MKLVRSLVGYTLKYRHISHASKVKVKLSLCLTKHHAMKTHWGVEEQLHSFFDLGTRWRRVVSFKYLRHTFFAYSPQTRL